MAGVLAVALLFLGCSRDEGVRLGDQMASAERRFEVSRIDLGTAAARPHLGIGWSADAAADGDTLLRSLGQQSSVEFFVSGPRPITVRARCRAAAKRAAAAATVSVGLNGTPVAEWPLTAELAERREPIAAELLRDGDNRLDFTYAAAAGAPATAPIECDWIAFDGLEDGAAPAARSDDGTDALTLPAHSTISFYFDVGEGAALEAAAVAPWSHGGPAGAATLEIRAERDGGEPQVARLAVDAPTGAQRWPLPPGPLRVTLRALPQERGGGIALSEPVLRLPPSNGAATAAACDAAPPDRLARPPIFIYLIDTLRADHLGAYGYALPTSPRIDAFAAEAVRFANAQSQSSWTKPSVASIFTGLTPHRHGANLGKDVMADVPTAAEILSANGYSAGAFVTNSAVAPGFGLDEGFAVYQVLAEQPIRPDFGDHGVQMVHQSAEVLRRTALEWTQRLGQTPPFVYLHATDPHDPYLPPQPYRDRFAAGADLALGLSLTVQLIVNGVRPVTDSERADIIRLYDAEIAYADAEFGAFLDDLRERGVYDDALVVLVSDHGEEFGEHDTWQHGRSLYPELIHVPLVIKFPRGWSAGRVVEDVAQHVDILPTLLDYLDVAPPPELTGSSLLPAIACPGSRRGVRAYSFVNGAGPTIETLVADRRQVIHFAAAARRPGSADRELYDLASDPGARRDLAASQPVAMGLLSAWMHPFQHDPDAAAAPLVRTPDAAARERLRALGYSP